MGRYKKYEVQCQLDEFLRCGKEHEIKSATAYKSYDYSNVDYKEQVRDLGIMMSNTTTFTLYCEIPILLKRSETRWDGGMGIESVSVAGALSHAETLEISCHSPTRVLLPSQNCTQSGANRFCLLISKQKDLSYSVDVITRYLIRKNKILNLKLRSRMFVLECLIFSSMIVRKTSRSHFRTNTWSHRH